MVNQPGSVLVTAPMGNPTWIHGSNDGSPLVTLPAGGLGFQQGPCGTLRLVTNLEVGGLTNFVKTITLTIAEGIITNVAAETGWTALPGTGIVGAAWTSSP
jgi:hypothetical protein